MIGGEARWEAAALLLKILFFPSLSQPIIIIILTPDFIPNPNARFKFAYSVKEISQLPLPRLFFDLL